MQAHHVADTKELVEAHSAKRDEPDGRTKAPGICELDPPDSRIRRQPCLSEKRVTASEYSAAKLRLVLYAAGSVRAFVTDALWERGIRASGAHALNAKTARCSRRNVHRTLETASALRISRNHMALAFGIRACVR